jgi:glycosyltransferase involved in cell wall biosynthesis
MWGPFERALFPASSWPGTCSVVASEPEASHRAAARGSAGGVLLKDTENTRAWPNGASPSLRKVALLGNHLPRQCGIATFTSDLAVAITDEFSEIDCTVVAMNDPGRKYAYPERVTFEIAATDIAAYRRGADSINASAADIVSVQHEYGIFGGKAGNHVLALLRDLRMPIVTTLHTILAEPDPQQRAVMAELTRLSARLVCMSASGAALLRDTYGVPENKIDLIPHGVPHLPDAQQSKAKLGVEGKPMILTFGLLSSGKGIEHVIDAMPDILRQHPTAIYVIVGATHPHVKESQGESYRLMLEARARRLGVDANVVFHNRFVEPHEVTEFLAAADIYVTPYLDPHQATSGTLAYAVGSGKATISTAYLYARELLAEGRGVLVPWPKDDPQGIARAVLSILGDETLASGLRERAAAFGQGMFWPQVARSYINSFERARTEHAAKRRASLESRAAVAQRTPDMPEVNLEHLKLLTDSTGIIQHAVFSVPRYQDGYCLDDNARALLLTTQLQGQGGEDDKAIRSLAARYLAFVSHAFDPESGRFHNFMSYGREWLDIQGSEDSHGRAIWGLGTVAADAKDAGHRGLAASLFCGALPVLTDVVSPRAWAYALLGIDAYLRSPTPDSQAATMRERLAQRLLTLYRDTSRPAWHWFEERATYGNARLSQALIVTGARLASDEMIAVGLQSLEWLCEVQRAGTDGYFTPIGSNGFYESGQEKAAFDQQPVEACGMVSACLDAQRVTGSARWMVEARRAFNWFFGQNALRQPVYDAETGACHDALHVDRVNQNQGAEATLSFLSSLVEMRAAIKASRVSDIHARGQMPQKKQAI